MVLNTKQVKEPGGAQVLYCILALSPLTTNHQPGGGGLLRWATRSNNETETNKP